MSTTLTKPFKTVRLIEQIKEDLRLENSKVEEKSPKKPIVSRHQFSGNISEDSDDAVFKTELETETKNIKNEVSEESDDELEFEKKLKTGELKVNQIKNETKSPKTAKIQTKSAYWNDMIGSTDSESDEDSYSYRKKPRKSSQNTSQKSKLSQGKPQNLSKPGHRPALTSPLLPLQCYLSQFGNLLVIL